MNEWQEALSTTFKTIPEEDIYIFPQGNKKMVYGYIFTYDCITQSPHYKQITVSVDDYDIMKINKQLNNDERIVIYSLSRAGKNIIAKVILNDETILTTFDLVEGGYDLFELLGYK